jgi:hypothetical protein
MYACMYVHRILRTTETYYSLIKVKKSICICMCMYVCALHSQGNEDILFARPGKVKHTYVRAYIRVWTHMCAGACNDYAYGCLDELNG